MRLQTIRQRLYRRRMTRGRGEPFVIGFVDKLTWAWPVATIGIGIAAIAASWATQKPAHANLADIVFALCWPICAGSAIGYGFTTLARQIRERRIEQFMGRLIHRVDFMGYNEEGDQVASVVRQNGEVLTVILPADYDPQEDNGREILRRALPEALEEDD